MLYPYIHFKFFKDTIENSKFSENFEFDDNKLFNFANFYNISSFYSLKSFKDKYDFKNKIDDNFSLFIKEILIQLKKKNNYDQLLFLYGILSTKILDKYIENYINNFDTEYSKIKAYTMLDFYYYSIDNINTKMNLYNQFKDSFNYYDYMDELIHNPIIKSISFLASKNYFNRCYKNKIKFYKRFKLNHRRYILHKIISKIFKSKYNIKDFINKNKIDTKLLNLANNEIDINDKKINKSLDDVIAIARDELNNYIDAINDYLFNDRDKNINKLLDE